MTTRHPVPITQARARPRLRDRALENHVHAFAEELADDVEGDFGFARGVEGGGGKEEEGLRDKGEVGGDEGEVGVRVLVRGS